MTDPFTMQMYARSLMEERMREADAVRLADSAIVEAPRHRSALRIHVATALRGLANRLQPSHVVLEPAQQGRGV